MDFVALDWTRMSSCYCIAGVIWQGGQYRVIRPLAIRQRNAPVLNLGWPASMFDGHGRWEVFELVAPRPGDGRAPHLEDVWVTALRPRNLLVQPEQRRAILTATQTPTDQPLFGAPFLLNGSTAYLEPGTGTRSLAGLKVPAESVHFSGTWKQGIKLSYQVSLPVPGLDSCIIPLKDHFLLRQAEQAHPDLEQRVAFLNQAVRRMGEQVFVRLGVSRPYAKETGGGEPHCYLMADGFFSLTEPAP